MPRHKQPSEAELLEQQRQEVKTAIEEGKTELDLHTESMDILREVCQVKTLTKLTLHTGKLPTLPEEIGNLANLEALHIDGNELTSLPESIGQLTRLHTLYAYHNQFATLPDSFGNLASLRKLVIWKNEIESLPKTFGRLTRLTEAELKWNKLSSLPDEIAGIESLEDLNLNSNQLASLPINLAGLKKLRRLDLAQNQFVKFPEGLLTLPALVELDLSRNALDTLPEGIGRLQRLRELNLSETGIRALPEALFKLPLAALDLQQAKLTKVPQQLAGMRQLIELKLWGNPLTDVPDEIQRGTKSDILRHLGLEKPRVVEGDLPPQAERDAILKRYQPRLDKLRREVMHRASKEEAERVLAFLIGKTNTVPSVAIEDDDDYIPVADALAPYQEWTFIDRRALAFLAQEAWHFKQPGHDYDSGLDEPFYRWLKPHLEQESQDSNLFGSIARELLGCGIDEELLLKGALEELNEVVLRPDGSPTSFGRYLLERAPEKTALLVELSDWRGKIKEAIVGLLIRHQQRTFARIGAELLTIKPDEDGETHIPYATIEQACSVEPERYQALLLEGIEKTDCDPCRAEAGRLLLSYFPKHRAQALEIAKRTLAIISERKNKQERYSFPWSSGKRWSDGTPQYIAWVLDKFGPEIQPQVRGLVENTKVFDLDLAEVLAKKLGQSAIDMLGEGLKMSVADDSIAEHFRRMFTLLAPLDWSKFHGQAWELARSEFKQVRQTACLALSRLDPALVVPKAKELLAAKKAHEREAGVLIFSLISTPEAKAELVKLLDSEKNDDARDIIVEAFFTGLSACTPAEAGARVQSAKARGKLDKPAAKWLDEMKLPKLVWTNGKPVDLDSLRFLFYRQTRQREIEVDPEARGVLGLVERKRSGDFAEKLLQLVLKNGGASAKNRFALALVGSLGDERIIAPLEELAIAGRNENAVRTIGLLGSIEAARSLDRIIKVFRVKYPNVRETAQESFGRIADSLGMTPFELADSMIPDFGMTGGRAPVPGTKPKLWATISGERKLALIDEYGKPIKGTPKTLDAKQKAAVKMLSEAVLESARALKSSLEYYLIVRRRWTLADFEKFILVNPLAMAFAQGLVWGAYEGGKLSHLFRITTERKPVDADGSALKLPASSLLGLVHPLELSEPDRLRWREVVSGTGMRPAFPQIDRPVFAPSAEEQGQTRCFRFEEKELSGLTFKGRAERLGWRRGSVVDTGSVSAYRKLFPHDQLEAFIRTEGLGVTGYGDDSEATLKDFFFVRAGAVVTGSYTYDEPREESDERLVKLAEVPPIVFSETVADLTTITKIQEEDD